AEDKASRAREAGAAEAIVIDDYETLPDHIKELTGGAGADHYIELVGTEATFLAGIRSLGRGGKVVIIGYTRDHLNVHPIELILSEIQVITSVAASKRDLETAIDLAAAGRLAVTIDTRYPLEEIGTAIERLQARQVRGR